MNVISDDLLLDRFIGLLPVGQRTEYEDEINRVSVDLLFATDFDFHNGAITPASVSPITTPASGADDLTHDGVPPDSTFIPADTPSAIASYVDSAAASAPTVISNTLVLDRRKSIGEMIFAIRDVGGGKVEGKGTGVNVRGGRCKSRWGICRGKGETKALIIN